jgi:ribosomal protein L37AE/L43A
MLTEEQKRKALSCYHRWKKTVLIVSTVWDCTKCGIKKEDWEKLEKEMPSKPSRMRDYFGTGLYNEQDDD